MNAHRAPAPRLMMLPHDHEAEQGVLGAVLHDNQALTVAADLLGPECFLSPRHRELFTGMVAMAAEEKPIDPVTLAAYFRGRGRLDQVGGQAYLLQVLDLTPVASNVAAYAEIVRGKWLLRNLIEKAQEIAAKGQEPTEDPEGLVVAANELFRELADLAERRTASANTQSAEDGVRDVLDWLDSAPEVRRDVLTGTALDEWTGPLSPDRPTVLAGDAGVSKSTVVHHIARFNARQNLPVLIFDLENGARKTWGRMLSAEAAVEGRKLLNRDRYGLTALDAERLDQAQAKLRELPIYLHTPRRLPTIRDMAHVARWHVENRGVALIVIDHIRLIRVQADTFYDEQRKRMAGVVALQKALRVPVIVVSHLNTEGRLRGAQELKDDSAAVVILEKNENPTEQEQDLARSGEHVLLARVVKNDTGPVTGANEAVRLKHWPWKFEVG